MLHTLQRRRTSEALSVKDNSGYLSHHSVVYYATDQKIFSSHKKIIQTEAKRVCTARRIFIFWFSPLVALLSFFPSFYLCCTVNSLPKKDSITEDNKAVIRNWSLSKVRVLFETLMWTQRIKWIILCCKSELHKEKDCISWQRVGI